MTVESVNHAEGPPPGWLDRRIGGSRRGFVAAIAVVVALALVAGGVVQVVLQRSLTRQSEINDERIREIHVLDRDLKEIAQLEWMKGELLARAQLVQDLGDESAAVAWLLAELGNRLRGGMVVTRIRRAEGEFEIRGRARTAARVREYVSGLDGSLNAAAEPAGDSPRCLQLGAPELRPRDGMVDFSIKARLSPAACAFPAATAGPT